jgi:hypothetical protein
MNKRNLFWGVLFLLFAALSFSAQAAELGVNYYAESLVGDWGLPYHPLSIEQVGRDFDNIKTISNNVKLYLNPYVNANLPWVQQVAAQAETRGMHTVVNIFADHRRLDAGNWDDYANRVVNACSAMNGKVDEFIVGNEITLHSSMSRTDIRDRVIVLMDRCDAVFDGQVSYEEFWYANDVWRGTNRPIYFMMYENIGAFRNNMAELSANFGSNGYIGEWGEDLLEDSIEHDEQWQKDQIQQRWDVIKNSPAPVAYLFTYREPSWTSFSMLRPGTDQRRPLWEAFGAAPAVPVVQPPVVQPPVVQPPVVQPPVVTSPVVTPPVQEPVPVQPVPAVQCTAPGCVVTRDVSDGVCRVMDFSTSDGPARVLECRDRLFVMRAPASFSACIDGSCVGRTGLSALDVRGPGSPVSDTSDGACRTVTYSTDSVKVCEKDGGHEMFLYGNANVCVDGNCVGPANGYARW